MEIIKTEEIKKWEEAGRIAAHALNFAKKITKQQVSLLSEECFSYQSEH